MLSCFSVHHFVAADLNCRSCGNVVGSGKEAVSVEMLP